MRALEADLKENFNEIMDAVSDDLLISDGEGRVLRISPDFEKVYGLDGSQIMGRTVYELEQEGYFRPSIIAVAIRRRERITMTQKNNQDRDIIVTATPVFDRRGEIKFVVSFSRDITEMVELQHKYSKLQSQMEKYTAELNQLRRVSAAEADIVVNSQPMRRILDTINRIADFDANVLLLGPSGVGKTMLAKIIHQKSRRAEGPFIDINCAAIPENLLESELFGYEKGSFTGADPRGKIGLIELADQGTLLLDEVSEIPITLQAKLLKAIQEKTIIRVGGRKPIQVDFRLIAASNRKLEQYSEEGKFRKDLYYRLNVVNIKIPPLEARQEDIIPLIDHFTAKFNEKYEMKKSFDPKAVEALVKYGWPGNVRELSNVVERVLVTGSAQIIRPADLPEEILHGSYPRGYSLEGGAGLTEVMEMVEEQMVRQAYERYGTTVGVARALKISQPTAFRKIEKYLRGGAEKDSGKP